MLHLFDFLSEHVFERVPQERLQLAVVLTAAAAPQTARGAQSPGAREEGPEPGQVALRLAPGAGGWVLEVEAGDARWDGTEGQVFGDADAAAAPEGDDGSLMAFDNLDTIVW